LAWLNPKPPHIQFRRFGRFETERSQYKNWVAPLATWFMAPNETHS
jgi:hypothetical protein